MVFAQMTVDLNICVRIPNEMLGKIQGSCIFIFNCKIDVHEYRLLFMTPLLNLNAT